MNWQRRLVLNLILLGVLVTGMLRMRQNWNEFEVSHRVESVQPEAEPVLTVPGTPAIAVTAEDWTEISVKNPFSFDRSDVTIVAPTQATPLQPKPVLFGTISIGNERIAMLAPGQSGTRASRPVKVGETLDNWEVVEITDNSVIVTAANGVRQTLIMNDPAERVPRSYDRTGTGGAVPAVNVVNTPAASPNPSGAAASGPAPAQPAPQPTSFGQPTGEILVTPFGNVQKTKQ